MSSLLTKRISSVHRHHLILIPHFLRLSLSTQSEQQPKNIPFIAQYLISSFGFSIDRALKYSAYGNLSPIKTPDRPDSVIQFFKKHGFSDAQIKYLISFNPTLLSSNTEKVLEPRARELMAAGFTGETLVELIRFDPSSIFRKYTLPRLQYWRKFVGNNDEALMKLIGRNRLLLSRDIDAHIVPTINLLKEYGFSQEDITKAMVIGHNIMLQNLGCVKQALERTEELGLRRGSASFLKALRVISFMKKEMWDKNIEFYRKTCGWSNEEFILAFKKYPTLLCLCDKTVETKINFLVNNANFEPKALASQPYMLLFSLEKRLAPRHRVLTILKEKGVNINSSFSTFCIVSDKNFVEKFVLPYREKAPELAKVYHFACA